MSDIKAQAMHQLTIQQATELTTLRAEVERLSGESAGRLEQLNRKSDEVRAEWIRAENAEAEVERLRAALREIDHARYTGRNTINPDNAFEHAVALNEKLITVMDIARAALAQEPPHDR